MMDKKELAMILDGREYGNETTEEIEKLAEDAGLVIVFAYSDDNMELRGAINDELGCYDGGEAYFKNGKLLHNECDNDACPHFAQLLKGAYVLEAVWNDGGLSGYTWLYQTDIPNEQFSILEDGEKFCRGIVFSIEDIK